MANFIVTAVNATSFDIGGETVNLSAGQTIDILDNGSGIGDTDDIAGSTSLAAEMLAGNATATWNGTVITAAGIPGVAYDSFYGSTAFQEAVDDATGGSNVGPKVDDLITLSGLPANSTDLGTGFNIIPDNATNQQAFTAIDTRLGELDQSIIIVGAWDASSGVFPGGGTAQAGNKWIVSVAGTVDSVSFSPGDTILAIVDNASTTTYSGNWIKGDNSDPVTASEIINVPAGDIGATNVQDALNELDTKKLALTGGTMTGSIAMSGQNITGAGTISGTTFTGTTFTGTSFSGTTFNGVALTAGGAATNFLNEAGAYVDINTIDDVITTQGDIVTGNASGDAQRVGLGAAGDLVGSDGTDVVYISRPYGQEFFLFENAAVQTITGTTQTDIINSSANILTTGTFMVEFSCSWNANQVNQDIVFNAAFDGTVLGRQSEIGRIEPKDAAGGDPDGTGSNQKLDFYRRYFVTVGTAGSKAVLFQFAGSNGSAQVSTWNAAVTVTKVSN